MDEYYFNETYIHSIAQPSPRATDFVREVVGSKYKYVRYIDGQNVVCTYLCDSYDRSCGFWMTNIADVSDRRNVSERAIGGPFRRIYEE